MKHFRNILLHACTIHIFDVTMQNIRKSLKISKGGNQNPYIEEEQITQWPKEKVQKEQTTIYKTYT